MICVSCMNLCTIANNHSLTQSIKCRNKQTNTNTKTNTHTHTQRQRVHFFGASGGAVQYRVYISCRHDAVPVRNPEGQRPHTSSTPERPWRLTRNSPGKSLFGSPEKPRPKDRLFSRSPAPFPRILGGFPCLMVSSGSRSLGVCFGENPATLPEACSFGLFKGGGGSTVWLVLGDMYIENYTV